MLELALQRGRVLQVGHLEWFNPALRELRGKIAEPRYVEAHRIGPYPGRGTDVDVVRDLMIHDLDILQQILGEEPDRIESVGAAVVSDQLDVANARLEFASGCIANLTASRVSRVALRRIRFFPREGCISIDFLARTAAILQLSPTQPETAPPATERLFRPPTPCSSARSSSRRSVRARRRWSRGARGYAPCAPRCACWKPCPASAILTDGAAGPPPPPRRERTLRALDHGLAALAALALAPLAAGALALRPAWRVGLRERLGAQPALPPPIWSTARGGGSWRLPGFGSAAQGGNVVTSTVTLSGREMMRRTRPDVPCQLAPLDHPWCVEAALSRVRPAALVLIETELWPSWLAAAERRAIPVALVSGRVSDHSYPRYRRLRRIIAPALRRIAALGARTRRGRRAFSLALARSAARVRVTGDLKLEPAEEARPLAPDLSRVLGASPLIVAGSTHPGEELAALSALAQVEQAGLSAALVLAPRRLGRADEIARIVRAKNRLLRRRTLLGDAPLRPGEVLLLDSVGELAPLYARAEVAFVGGSLVSVEHNVLAVSRDVLSFRPAHGNPPLGGDPEAVGGRNPVADASISRAPWSRCSPIRRSAADAARRDDARSRRNRGRADALRTDRGSARAVSCPALMRAAWPDSRETGLARWLALSPLALVAGFWSLGARLHRALYRTGTLEATRLPCRVVSVGNLGAGGTGKTPAAAWLASRLQRRGNRVVLASRGYRRRGRAAVVTVSDGRFVHATVEQAGDELRARRARAERPRAGGKRSRAGGPARDLRSRRRDPDPRRRLPASPPRARPRPDRLRRRAGLRQSLGASARSAARAALRAALRVGGRRGGRPALRSGRGLHRALRAGRSALRRAPPPDRFAGAPGRAARAARFAFGCTFGLLAAIARPTRGGDLPPLGGVVASAVFRDPTARARDPRVWRSRRSSGSRPRRTRSSCCPRGWGRRGWSCW